MTLNKVAARRLIALRALYAGIGSGASAADLYRVNKALSLANLYTGGLYTARVRTLFSASITIWRILYLERAEEEQVGI